MNTKTNKQEKRDTLLLASFYAAVAIAAVLLNLVTFILQSI